MLEYYNISSAWIKIFSWPAGLLLVVIALCIILRIASKRKSNKLSTGLLIGTVCLGIITLICSFVIIQDYVKYTSILKQGKYKEVEGYVENFQPQPIRGRERSESFTVNGVKFIYSDFWISQGFHETKLKGGPIDSGKYVKIRYYDGLILQLWVK